MYEIENSELKKYIQKKKIYNTFLYSQNEISEYN